MVRARLVLLALLCAASSLSAHSDVSGNWRVEFVVPKGEEAVNMTINQRDDILTGNVINEDGEFPLSGTVAGNRVTVKWTVAEQGHPLEITMTGTIEGEYITGTASLANVGEGELTAHRVSRNP